MQGAMNEIGDLISRHGQPGHQATVIPGLTLYQVHEPNQPVNTIYRPTLCVIAQGRKRVVLGKRIVEYDASKYLVVAVDLPVSGCVVEASPGRPYLGLSLDLNPVGIADLLLSFPPALAGKERSSAALAVSALDSDLVDVLARMVRLLDRPNDIATLAPLIEREILYRMLQGGQGGLLRQVATASSYLVHIARAIDTIRENYAEQTSIEALAQHAGMSVTSFHRHFKAITTMTPLQYRTQFRLQEARQRLLADEQRVGRVAFDVGYNNPSQFSRDYRRMFGLPPAADAARLRGSQSGLVAV